MLCSVMQDQFHMALKRVKAAVMEEPILPIFENVLLKAEEGRLMVAATNLELSIITFIGARVDREGAITIPHSTLEELVGNLSPERVDLKLDEVLQTLSIHCGAAKSNLIGINAIEYPFMEEKKFEGDVIVLSGTFREMVKRTAYATARSDARPILQGLHLITCDGRLHFEATDGYKLALDCIEAEVHKSLVVNVPKNTLQVVARLATDDYQGIHIACIDTKIYFQFGATQVIGQTLEGIYPDVNRVVPQSFLTTLRVCREELQRALRRAEIFAKDNDYYCTIVANDTLVDVSTHGSERGDLIGSLSTELQGESLTVGCNIKYMQQALNAISSEWVMLSGSGPAGAIVIRPEGESGTHLIMPMNLR